MSRRSDSRHVSEHLSWPLYEPDPQDCVLTREGYVWYGFYERIAICLESGLTLRVAVDVAFEDQRRYISRSLWSP